MNPETWTSGTEQRAHKLTQAFYGQFSFDKVVKDTE